MAKRSNHDAAKDIKKVILAYLMGLSVINVKNHLAEICNKSKNNAKSITKSIVINPNDPLLIAILNSLNISSTHNDEAKRELFKELTDKSKYENIYELLLALCKHSQYEHVHYLVKLINKARPQRNLTLPLLFAALGTGILGIFFAINQKYLIAIGHWLLKAVPKVIFWLGKTFSMVRNIPLLGLVYKSLALLYNWYEVFSTATITRRAMFSQLFFQTVAASLSITAYILAFLADGFGGIPSAALFILSACTDIFQSLYNWHKRNKAWKKHPALKDDDSWETQAEYYRAQSLNNKDAKTIGINILAAILTATAVGIWCAFPGSLAITITCVGFMMLISFTARSMLSGIQKSAARKLQSTLKDEISVDYPDYANQSELLMNGHEGQQAALARREEQCVAKEAALEQREKNLQHIDELTTSVKNLTAANERLIAQLTPPKQGPRSQSFGGPGLFAQKPPPQEPFAPIPPRSCSQ